MSKPQQSSQSEKQSGSDWVKVAPCLYRYRGGTYYSLLKHHGKQIRRSLETTDRKLAERRLAKAKEDLTKINPSVSRRTIDEHLPTHEKTLGGVASTISRKKHYLKKFITEWPKDAPREIRHIKKTHIASWLMAYTREEWKPRPLAPATLNHLITEVRSFFETAVIEGVIAESPARDITYGKVPKPKRKTPTPEEFDAILANIRSQKANGHGAEDSADTVELAGRLGLGQAELAGIRRMHINLETNTISITIRRKTKVGFVIPIFPQAMEIILRRLADMPSDPEARLLPNYNFRKALEGACARLNLPRFEPRSLRRRFVTTAFHAGVDAATIAAWQGHQDGGALVLKTYSDEVRMPRSQEMAKLLAPKPAGGNVLEFPKEATA